MEGQWGNKEWVEKANEESPKPTHCLIERKCKTQEENAENVN